MRCLILLSFVVYLLELGHCKQDFFNCTGNDHNTLTRRCCNSNLLPFSCECFDISSKSYFRNSGFALPQCPDVIPVKFIWYSRKHADGVELTAAHLHELSATHQHKPSATHQQGDAKLNPTEKWHFLVHGFTADGNRNWMKAMRIALLLKFNCNVVTVDWSAGAGHPYNQAVANVRTAAAVVARHVAMVAAAEQMPLEDVHLIGHSLGAHVAGLAGQEVKRLAGKPLGRISGLDPAGPLFLTAKNIVILDKTDALFVDIIHTNGNLAGMMRATGHADFYPNGGEIQKSCSLVDPTCSHSRCHEMYLSSILEFCTYDVKNAQEEVCDMGYYANNTCTGVFRKRDFKTTGVFPYCFEH